MAELPVLGYDAAIACEQERADTLVAFVTRCTETNPISVPPWSTMWPSKRPAK
jgi:hypothetical protein